MRFLAVKNFERLQHYTDRSPPWIKLYNSLLDDYAFLQLSDTAQANLVKIWLLASRHDNRIPNDSAYIAGKIRPRYSNNNPELFQNYSIDIQELINAKFLYLTDTPARKRPRKTPRKARNDKGITRKRHASTALANGKHDAMLEGEGETEGETEERRTHKIKGGAKGINWAAEGTEWWREHIGSTNEKTFGATLVDVVRTHGWPAVFAGAQEYANVQNGRDKRLDWFAKDAVRWIKQAAEPLVDANGEPTSRADRILGLTR